MNKRLLAIDMEDKALQCRFLITRLLNVCSERGVEPNKLLRGTKLFIDDLQKDSGCFSAKTLLTIIDNVLKTHIHQQVSFIIGRQLFNDQDNNSLIALNHCKTLEQVITIIARQPMLYCPLFGLKIYRVQHQIHLQCIPAFGMTAHQYQFFCEIIAAAMKGLFKRFVDDINPIAFHFPYRRPTHIEQYQQHLGLKTCFTEHLFLMSFNKEYFRKGVDLLLLSKINSKKDKSAITHVGLLYYITQYIKRFPNSGLADVAAHLSISPATLKRKLKQHKSNFQQLQDVKRAQQAVFRLLINNDKNTTIASNLKFEDINNFRRSFKRWTGQTPSEYKEHHPACCAQRQGS